MDLSIRNRRQIQIEVDGLHFDVSVLEIPFREGVEFRCMLGEEELRVGDRGLGEEQAIEVLKDEIRKARSNFGL